MTTTRRRSKLITAISLSLVITAMLGLTAASVPLYRLFCEATGYGGTIEIASEPASTVSERTIKVRFDATIGDELPWRFSPVQRELEVRLGEENLAFFQAENLSDQPVVGQATFNVTPLKAGAYFDKLACFCFEEQTLQPGEIVDMPVSFYVDPAIFADPNTRELKTLTLSYTFYMLDDETETLVGRQKPDRPAS
jgi:cytochrome c oxidase assembly protein subunit 11